MVGYVKNNLNTNSDHLLSLQCVGALSSAARDILSFNLRR